MYSFHHVALSVSNTEKSVSFYELLGFKKAGGWEPDDKSFTATNLRNGDMVLELFCYSNHKPLPQSSKDLYSDLPVLGTKHFGLHVDSIMAAKNDIESKGIKIVHADIKEDGSDVSVFFVQDPDGILVEITDDK